MKNEDVIRIIELQGKYPGSIIKIIQLCNVNNKKCNDSFLEVNFAPQEPVPESSLATTLFAVSWDGEAYAEDQIYKIEELIRVPFCRLPSVVTYASAGMDSLAFREWWKGFNPETRSETEMGIYIYKRLK